ncbi:MAG: VOC family protein [Propionicimonas sp.]|uniref:VOC family protein n=1 Tax=Propionicimonas sp. TaxID=1955623 RepID=UPI003D11189A
MTAFLDFAPDEFGAGTAFWRAATGYGLSPFRGAASEFATLVPTGGDDYLKVQRLGAGLTRLHLDVHVPDPWAAAEAAERAGAVLVDETRHSYVVLRSPAGFTFCLVSQPASVVPPVARWESGHRSRVSRFCLDVPRKRYAAEVAFARQVLGGDWRELSEPETALRPAGELPLDVRLQPAEFASEVSTHLHVITDDLAAEVDRLVDLGARRRAVRTSKAILESPGGMVLCVVALEAAALA